VGKSEPAALLLASLGAYLDDPLARAILAAHTLSWEKSGSLSSGGGTSPQDVVAQQQALVVSVLKDLFPVCVIYIYIYICVCVCVCECVC
jgi:hypothetical protein